MEEPQKVVVDVDKQSVHQSIRRHVSEKVPPKRGLSLVERQARIQHHPLRSVGIARGRQRLAKIEDNLNDGVKTLSSLRLAAGLSQAELASKMDMKQPNIARIEKKPSDPSLSTLIKLANALGVSVLDVIDAIKTSAAINDTGQDSG